MTQQHPNILGAFAALRDLADQQRYLADLLEPGTRAPRNTPRLTPAARAQLNRQTIAERHDQVETARQGLAPRGPGKTPVVLGVLDAQLQAVEVVMHAAWRTYSHLAHLPWRIPEALPVPYRGGGVTDGARFTIAVNYLEQTLPLVHPDLADELGRQLNAVAKLCEQVTGHAPSRHDLADDCPACGDRFLQVTTWGTDDAVVTCRCRCYGVACLCRRPNRMPGMRHLWQASEFDQLTRLLRRGEAA